MKLLEDAVVFGRKVVVADLHLGLIRFYDAQIVEKLKKFAEKYRTVIIAGDLKHIGKKAPIDKFLMEIEEIAEVIVVRGNHDIGIRTIAGSRGIRVGKYGVFHGHALPNEDVIAAKHLIFGHAHPSVFIPDDVGGVKERAFLVGGVEIEGEKKNVTVLPAFNDLCASTAVNLERPAGFAFRKWDYRKWEAVLPDGTVLGIENLQQLNNHR